MGGLTPRPGVSVLMRASAIGMLAATPTACGGDDGGTTMTTNDVHPTAGPCAHDPSSPGCSTSTADDGGPDDGGSDTGGSSGGDTADSTGAADSDGSGSDGSSSGDGG